MSAQYSTDTVRGTQTAATTNNLPYRFLYASAFLHMTTLCCLQSPPPYIHERRPRGKKEREGLLQGHSFKILFSDYYLTQQHFKSDYCTVYHIPLYFLTIGWNLHPIWLEDQLSVQYSTRCIVYCTILYKITFVIQYYNSVKTVIQYLIRCIH